VSCTMVFKVRGLRKKAALQAATVAGCAGHFCASADTV
jgi:hypothetical protein